MYKSNEWIQINGGCGGVGLGLVYYGVDDDDDQPSNIGNGIGKMKPIHDKRKRRYLIKKWRRNHSAYRQAALEPYMGLLEIKKGFLGKAYWLIAGL